MLKTILLTALALIAFAANSVLGRMALGNSFIDASGFTSIRLISGTAILLLIIQINNKNSKPVTKGKWISALLLFIYAISFSYAYNLLDTGTGALILFGAVQISMILISLFNGKKLHFTEWIGVFIAFIGFIYLILPGVTAPSLKGFLLMSVSGIAWGVYSIKGQASTNPLYDTAYNFLKSLPFVAVILLLTFKTEHYTLKGILLAIISGSITSGIGYTIWYMALKGLTSVQAAVVQLLVPVIAAFGGVIFIAEIITTRLTMASVLILGGVLIVVLGRKYFMLNN